MKTTRRMKPNLNLRKNPKLKPRMNLNLWMNPKLKPWKNLNLWLNPKLNLRKNLRQSLNLNLSPRKNLRQSLNPRQKLRLSQSLTPRLAGASFAGYGLCSGLRQGMCL